VLRLIDEARGVPANQRMAMRQERGAVQLLEIVEAELLQPTVDLVVG
jgi:hypothetical protein